MIKTLLLATRNRHKVGEIRSILGAGFDYLTLDDFPNAPGVVEDATTFAGNAAKKAMELGSWIPSQKAWKTSPRDGALWVLADDSGLEVDALRGAPGVLSARFAALDTGSPGNSTDAANIEKLLRLMAGVPDSKRGARFRCVIALICVRQAVTPLPKQTRTPALSLSERERVKHLAPLLDSLDAEFMEREGMCLPIPGEGERARVFSLDGSGLISSCETALPEAQAQPGERDVPRFDGVCEGRILERPSGVGGFGYDSLFVPAGFSQTFAELGDEAKNQISHRANALRQLKQALL